MRSIRYAGALALLLGVTWAAPPAANGVLEDHLKCYKVKDSLSLGGLADLFTPQFGVDPGCKISKATLFCVPSRKTRVEVTNKATKQLITPLPVRGGTSSARPDDRICYKIKCPNPATPITDQSVTDQFGNRTMSKFKASLLCTPAFKGTARFVDNGNSITDNYTGLQWMETNNGDGTEDLGNPQDADNRYTWSVGGCPFTGCPNGAVFTDFLGRLNACTISNPSTPVFLGFAGHCDWRLPTLAELQTIVDCSFGSPCINPVFGPTAASFYWSSTTDAGDANVAWRVNFGGGGAGPVAKDNPFVYVRAVRGGSAD